MDAGTIIKKAVIPAAGLGTRLLPFTKEIPKEMMPIFTKDANGQTSVKPVVQAIFEQLYDYGIREFCFIVGRGKRAIEDHFTPDQGFLDYLTRRNADSKALTEFYGRTRNSSIVFVNQPEPRGFGDAVLRVEPYARGPLLVHAGDTYIISRSSTHLRRLEQAYQAYGAEAAILLQKVRNPQQLGVANGKEVERGVYTIKRVEEKPAKPRSDLAIMPAYIFKDSIYRALAKTRPDRSGELQLTDGIQQLIQEGRKIVGVELKKGETRLDIGTPHTLFDALRLTATYLPGTSIR